MEAARREKSRLGACRVVAFLLRRPSGITFDGGNHAGAFGFVAFDVDVLLQWNVASIRAPSHLALFGALLELGCVAEPEILIVPPAPARPPPRDRWADLQQLCVRPGCATLRDFVKVFGLSGRQGLKSAAGKVSKRLRDNDFTVDDHTHGVGRPVKVGRLMDLKRCYAALQ